MKVVVLKLICWGVLNKSVSCDLDKKNEMPVTAADCGTQIIWWVFIKSKMCASNVHKLHKNEVPVTAEDELMC